MTECGGGAGLFCRWIFGEWVSGLQLLVNRLVKAIVLLASKDKRELAFRAKEVVADYEDTALLYIGEVPQKRVFLV